MQQVKRLNQLCFHRENKLLSANIFSSWFSLMELRLSSAFSLLFGWSVAVLSDSSQPQGCFIVWHPVRPPTPQTPPPHTHTLFSTGACALSHCIHPPCSLTDTHITVGGWSISVAERKNKPKIPQSFLLYYCGNLFFTQMKESIVRLLCVSSCAVALLCNSVSSCQ